MTAATAPRSRTSDIVINDEHKELFEALEARESVLLVGGAGRGKSTSSLLAAEHLGLDIDQQWSSIDVNPHQDMTEVVYGKQVCIGPGEWAFKEAPPLERYEHGGLLCVNEVTSTRADVAHVWHPIAGREPLTVSQASGSRKAECHENFFLIGTSNGSEYAGNHTLSAAFYDRWYIIPWNGLSEAEETEHWLKRYPNVQKGILERLIAATREWSVQNRGVYDISMRGMRRCLRRLDALDPSDRDGFVRVVASTIVRPVRILAPTKCKSLVETLAPRFQGVKQEMFEKYL